MTPQNITKITPDMYRNAATTLGIEHAKITVAAPIAVTGESALAGIYYSLEQNVAKVSDESKELAQEELKTLSQINEENSVNLSPLSATADLISVIATLSLSAS